MAILDVFDFDLTIPQTLEFTLESTFIDPVLFDLEMTQVPVFELDCGVNGIAAYDLQLTTLIEMDRNL